MEKTDKELEKCYGVGFKACKETECRLRGPCESSYRENYDTVRRNLFRTEEEYSDEMDAEGTHSKFSDHISSEGKEDAKFERFGRLLLECNISEKERKEFYELWKRRKKEKNIREELLELIRSLGELYVHDRVGFEVLFFELLANGSQAAYARMCNCRRQNINKKMKSGRRRYESYLQRAKMNEGQRLTPLELAVYRAVVIEKMTYRKAGEEIGVSKNKIMRVGQKLRQKGIKMGQTRHKKKQTKQVKPEAI